MINAGIPAILALLFRDSFLQYIETAAGFLAPMFLIWFPCLITLRLDYIGKAKIGKPLWFLVILYMIGGMVWSYTALVLNLMVENI